MLLCDITFIQCRSRHTVFTYELHNQNITLHVQRFGHWHFGLIRSFQVLELLPTPQVHDISHALLYVPEPWIACYVLHSVFEFCACDKVDLYCDAAVIASHAPVDP